VRSSFSQSTIGRLALVFYQDQLIQRMNRPGSHVRCHSCHNQIVKDRPGWDFPKENPTRCCQMDRGRASYVPPQASRETRPLAICFITRGPLTLPRRNHEYTGQPLACQRANATFGGNSVPAPPRSLAGNGLRFPGCNQAQGNYIGLAPKSKAYPVRIPSPFDDGKTLSTANRFALGDKLRVSHTVPLRVP